MARDKGTGNLQQEKGGRWTVRIGVNGRRLSRSAGTDDRSKAERFLQRFLAPLGLGTEQIPLAEAWRHYEMSPNRRDLARSTLDSKRIVWMGFARWLEQNHIEIAHLAEVTETAVAEYLAEFRCHHSASTYNGHVCVLREIFHVLAVKAGVTHDPWAGVSLRADDSMSRRELSLDEIGRLYEAAAKEGAEWKLLLMTGIYTGMRLGDCCRLKWENVNLERSVIQVVPEKTKRHMHGRPVTIPIHPSLMSELQEVFSRRDAESQRGEFLDRINKIDRIETPTPKNSVNPVNYVSKNSPTGFVNPVIAEMYLNRKWQLDEGLRKIFKAAHITMSIKVEGRCRKTVVASFHSLRHTFVSLSANAGVPLPVVQSIVGHCSTAMTRHYYHENEAVLRQAVDAIPAIGPNLEKSESRPPFPVPHHPNIPARLRRLDRYLAQGVISEAEYAATRQRILDEM